MDKFINESHIRAMTLLDNIENTIYGILEFEDDSYSRQCTDEVKELDYLCILISKYLLARAHQKIDTGLKVTVSILYRMHKVINRNDKPICLCDHICSGRDCIIQQDYLNLKEVFNSFMEKINDIQTHIEYMNINNNSVESSKGVSSNFQTIIKDNLNYEELETNETEPDSSPNVRSDIESDSSIIKSKESDNKIETGDGSVAQDLKKEESSELEYNKNLIFFKNPMGFELFKILITNRDSEEGSKSFLSYLYYWLIDNNIMSKRRGAQTSFVKWVSDNNILGSAGFSKVFAPITKAYDNSFLPDLHEIIDENIETIENVGFNKIDLAFDNAKEMEKKRTAI